MSSSRLRALIPFSLLALALTATPGYSTTTTFSDFASWQSAATILQTIDFEGKAPTNGVTTYPGGLTQNGVQFIGYTSASYFLEVIDTNYSTWTNFGTNDAAAVPMNRAQSDPLPYFHIILPAAVTAFGVDLFTASPNGLTFTITVAGTPYSAATTNHPNPPAFFGFTSDTPITTVDLTLQGTVYNGDTRAFIDNFRFGTAETNTPEAVTSLLIGSGLLWIGFMRRRAKTNSHSRRSQPKIAAPLQGPNLSAHAT